jgi:histidinol phosphatase-like enzyme
VAFFDADSTLRVSRSGAFTATDAADVQVLPLVAEKIAALNANGYLVAIVSNQGGVGRKSKMSDGTTRIMTIDDAAGGLLTVARKIHAVAQQHGLEAHVDYIDLAEGSDAFHKPGSGMAQMLSDALAGEMRPEYAPRLGPAGFRVHPSCVGKTIDWSASFMVGDAAYQQATASAAADAVPTYLPTLPGSVDPKAPYPRRADDFSNGDRLFAERLRIRAGAAPPVAQPLAFQEPADYFGWWAFGAGNIVPDALKDAAIVFDDKRLSFVLDAMSRAAERREARDPVGARRLRDEVAAVRSANDDVGAAP